MKTKELRDIDWWIFENVMVGKGTRACIVNCKLYSTDPSAAMEVLKKCIPKAEHIEFDQFPNGDFGVFDWNNYERAKTLELAICLFAKKLFSK